MLIAEAQPFFVNLIIGIIIKLETKPNNLFVYWILIQIYRNFHKNLW